MSAKQELTTVEKPGALGVPDYLKGVHGREGSENVTRADLIVPRLAICQSMTPERKPDNPKYIKGLNDGDLFNTGSQEVYGRVVNFIPLIYNKSRILFAPGTGGNLSGNILCQSFNGINGGRISPLCENCAKSKFGADGEAPECTNFMNFPSLILPSLDLAVAAFKSTALKPARQFVSRMDLFSQKHNKPYYTSVYELKVLPSKNAMGEFFTPSFMRVGWATEDQYNVALEHYTSLKGKTIQTEERPEEQEDGPVEHVPF